MAHKSGLEEDFTRFAPLSAKDAKKLGRKVKLQDNWEQKQFYYIKSINII